MSLTVGELNAIMSVDDRTVDPALRRVEQAMRASGQRIGTDLSAAGQQAGQRAGTQLGQGLVRGADGQWRNMRGELVDAVTAAAAEAEAEAHRAGRDIGEGVTAGLRGVRSDAARAGQQAGDALGDGLTDEGTQGADEAAQSIGDRLRDRMKLAGAAAGVAVGAILMDALGQAMEQGKISGRLAAQLGATGAEAQKYGHIAGSMYADAVTEDFQGAADAISVTMRSGLLPTGATEAQIESLSTKVSDLAGSFELDIGQAANAAGQMIKTGLVKDGTEALDVMTRGLQVMGPRADDLADTFNEYSTIFRNIGLDATTATGLLSQGMAAGARDTDVVADALKELTLIVQGGGKKVDEAFGKIGLSGKEMTKAFSQGGPEARKALDEIFDRLRKVKDPADRAQLAVSLFGTKAEDTQKALFALDPSKAVAALGEVGGSADKMGDSLRDNSGARLEAFKRGMQQNLVGVLGGEVLPRLQGFFDFLSDNKPVVYGIAAAVTALGVAFSLAAIGVWAMNSAMLANPMFWIIAGIAAVVAGLVILIVTYWDEIVAATSTAWGWVVKKVTQAKDGILAAVSWLSQIPGWVSAWFGQAKDWAVKKLLTLVAWMVGLPGRMGSAISALPTVLWGVTVKAFTSMRDGAAKKVLSFLSWARGIPGRISSALGSLNNLLVSKGADVVRGLWAGIQGMGGWIKSQLISWAKSVIPGPIAKALGINSPSKVTKAQGRWIARGLIDGLTGSTKQIKAASGKLADIIADSLKPGKKRSKALSTLGKGTKQLLALAKREETLAARLKTSTKRLDDLRKARATLAADVAKGVLDSANITSQETGGWPQTAESILAGLRADTLAAQAFAKNLAALRKKGVRSDLISQIARAGVEGGSSAAAALANANSSQVKQINSQQAALVKAAAAAGATAGDAMYGAGIRAAQGLVSGLQSQQKAIERQMLTIARGMSKSIRAALGIKSPSRVMALVGMYTAQGLIKGVDGQRSAVNRSMASLVETPAPGSWDMASAGARRAAANKTVIEIRTDRDSEGRYLMGQIQRGIRKTAGPDIQYAFTGKRSG
ncbi:phage tail tape measure protein [Streptomyces sp. NPDC047042]|uniref:phage tail tape measure protein n=1 Tax=Streptomyces sp. NPDC047042 TaxID=3154807 RepID=UPI003409CA1F